MTTDTALVTGTDFVALPTRDYEVAAEFYGEVLGLPFGKRWGGDARREFETGNLTLAVMQCDVFGIQFQPSKVLVALQVEDVQPGRGALESAGRLRPVPSSN